MLLIQMDGNVRQAAGNKQPSLEVNKHLACCSDSNEPEDICLCFKLQCFDW